MDIFALLFVLWLAMRWTEGRENRERFATRTCGYCPGLIAHDKQGWFHVESGQCWDPIPGQNLDYLDSPIGMHAALPPYA